MTKHYKDVENRIYGYVPKNIEVVEISVDEAREISKPTTTFEQEIEIINSWRDAEIEKISLKFAGILLINGTYQSAAEEGIRQSMLASINNKYDEDIEIIKIKYGV